MNEIHEKKVCIAIIDYIYTRKGIEIDSSKIKFPDKENRNIKSIDLLYDGGDISIAIALEHTSIDSYMGQRDEIVRAEKLLKPLETILENKLPKPGHYKLYVDVGATKGATDTSAIIKRLVSWITTTAPSLDIGSPDTTPNHFRKGQPDGVPFEVTLRRWPRRDGKFIIVLNCPEFEALRKERIEKALNDKCPKLLDKAKSEKAISVLILEMNDFVLGNPIEVASVIHELSQERTELPDDIYLVETDSNEWDIWVIKKGKLFFKDLQDTGPYLLPIPRYCDTILRLFYGNINQ
jgi:hypothetical protein